MVVEDKLVEELVEEEEEETEVGVDEGSNSDMTHEHAELIADGMTLQCETKVGRLVVWVTTAVVYVLQKSYAPSPRSRPLKQLLRWHVESEEAVSDAAA